MEPQVFITHTSIKTEMQHALELIFIKWWQVGTGLIATWITAIFGESIMLTITPEFAKAWIPIVGSLLILLITLLFLFRKKNNELRQLEEKHKQELWQDELEDCRKLWLALIESGKIEDTMTLPDFKANYYDKIKNPAVIGHK